MSEEKPNIEEMKKQLDELREFIELSDKKMKNKLLNDVKDQFSSKEKVAALRESYEASLTKLEGMIMFVEGLSKMSDAWKDVADPELVMKMLGEAQKDA
jgi:hypothetical protein